MSIDANSLNEIKSTLKLLSASDLRTHLLRLAKYKKENKELLSFILYLEDDMQQFVKDVKQEIDQSFLSLHATTTYLSAKGLRKILKGMNKFIKFSGNKEVETELVIYFCTKMKSSSVQFNHSVVLNNLYNRQVERAARALEQLHEDKQGDYRTLFHEIGK